MNKLFCLALAIIISLSLICCGGKKIKPDPEKAVIDNKTIVEEKIAQDSLQDLPAIPFYKFEESIEDIQKQIAQLQAQVSEYKNKSSDINYTEKLKKLIDEHPPAAHKIALKNGSLIEGTIEKDRMEDLMVKTKVGLLTIEKKEIDFIENLILPVPHIVFIGHGREQVFDSHHLFTGKVLNKGGRRGDFVRIIYQLWGEDTQIIKSDSAFVDGTKIMYKSGIITDTALEPNQSVLFSVQVPIDSEIPISYVTREVRWLLYD